MKGLVLALFILAGLDLSAQSVGRFRYDSTIFEKVGGSNEVVFRNKTRDTLGFLYNTGGGVTQFKRVKQINDTTVVFGVDTILIKSAASGGSGLNTLNGLNAGLQTLSIGTSGTAPNWVSAGSTHTLNVPSALSAGVLNGTVPYTRTQIWDAKIGAGDTALMLANYLNSVDTVSLSNRINAIKASGITALIADVVSSAPDPFGVAIAQLSNTGVTPGTFTNPTVTVDSKGRILNIANGSGGGGSGTDNVNGGSGYRWVIGGQVIRSAVAGNGILIDSITTGSLTFKADTSILATINDVVSATNGITSLTGDVTGTGPGATAATIANDAVTFAKFQNLTSQRLLGRFAGTDGDAQYITLGTGFTLNTTTGVLDFAGGSSYTFTAPLSETGGVVSIANAAADGATKGASSYATNEFNSSAGVISLDVTNGPTAGAGTKGYLTPTDWATFNSKISNITGLVTAGTNVSITGTGTSGSPYVINAPNSGTVNTGFANTLAYYPTTGTTVDDLAPITPSRALSSDANGLPVASATTATELGYMVGVTSGIQAQLNNKQNTITTGSTAQYFRGDLSLATFPTNVSTFTNDAAYLTNITGKVTAGTNISITGSGTTASPYVVSSSSTGLADGDKGDITVSSTGAVWNIDPGVVGNTEISDVAWGKITGVPTDIVYLAATQTLTNKTLTSPKINVGTDATGDMYYRDAGGNFTRLGIGSTGQVIKVVSGLPSWAADATSGGGGATLSDGDYGDVTVSGTGTSILIDGGAVTNPKLANMPASTFKARLTASTGSPEDITVAQATTMLDVFTSTLKGLAPASSGGTTNFLRADGTWAAPASGYSFEPNDFNGTTTISIDYTNGQKATNSIPGFLTAADHATFLAKQNAITTGTTAQYFRGDLSLATFPTNVSSFTNDAGYLINITGKVTAGSNVTITGLGTTASPYIVNSATGTTYSNGYGLNLAGTTFSVDTATIFAPYLTAINARIKYSDSSTMLTAYRNALNTKLENITGKIVAGTNITISGAGTTASPYSIAAAGSAGVADGDKGDITVSSSGSVWNIDAGAVGNTEIAGGVDATKLADGSVTNTEFQYIGTLSSNAQTQINSKQNIITTGTTAQYFRGDFSLATFPTGLSSFTNDPGFITNITGKINAGTNVTITGAGTTASPYVVNASGGGGSTLSGTANRITIASDVVDIASTYVGQTSITTLGTIGTGTWNGTAIANNKGGLPTGGSAGWMLYKSSSTDFASSWGPAPSFTPTAGYGIFIDGENDITLDTAASSIKYIQRGNLVAGTNITITPAGNQYVIASSGGGGLTDGDKSDITVSASGATWIIDNSAVTNAKVASGIDGSKSLMNGYTTPAAAFSNVASTDNAVQAVSKLEAKIEYNDAKEYLFHYYYAQNGNDGGAALNAINAIMPDGAFIRVKEGTYNFTTAATMTKSFKMVGAGRWNTIFRTTSATLGMLTINTSTYGHSISDLKFVNEASTTPTAGFAIRTVGTTGNFNQFARYQNLYLDRFYDNFYNSLGSGSVWEGVFFDRPIRYGLFMDNTWNPDSGDGSVSNCSFYGNDATVTTALLRQEGSGGLKITNSKFNSNSTTNKPSYSIDLNITGATSDFLISNTSLENFGISAIRMRRATGIVFREVVISGNQFSAWLGNTANYIDIGQGIENITITGNVFRRQIGSGAFDGAIKLDGVNSASLFNGYYGFSTQNPVTVTSSSNVINLNDGSGGGSSYWIAGTGSSIYYNDKVGILGDPTVDFHLNKSSGLAQAWMTGSTGGQIAIGSDPTGADGTSGGLYRPTSSGTLFVENLSNSIILSRAFTSGAYIPDFRINASGGTLYANSLNDATGVAKMVTVTNGLFSYAAIPGGGGGGGENLSSTLAIGNSTGGQGINFSTASGTNRNYTISTLSAIDNLSFMTIQPTSGTNVGMVMSLAPLGAGDIGTTGLTTQFTMYHLGDDNASNFEALALKSASTGYTINSSEAGTGVLRPLSLQMGGVNAISVGTSGAVTINASTNSYALPTGRGTSGYVMTTDGAGGTSWAVASGGGGTQNLNEVLTEGNSTGGLSINMAAGSGTNRNVTLYTESILDNMGFFSISPTSGTNVGTSVSIAPAGAGDIGTTGTRTQLNLYGLGDDNASNFEVFQIRSTSTAFNVNVSEAGTGVLRPLSFQMAGVEALGIATDRSVIINDAYILPLNQGTVGHVLTQSTSGQVIWAAGSGGGGGVTAVSGGSTGLTFTGTTSLTMGGTLAIASGGTGTSTPALVAGTGISITGSWPNQTISATGGTGSTPISYLTGVSTGTTPLLLTGSMGVSSGESGEVEITIYCINSASNSSFVHKVIIPYLATSGTAISFGTELNIGSPEAIGSALSTMSGSSWDYGVDGSTGDITITVTGVSGQSIQWRAEIKKYVVTWSS